jgi:hypothetical protein
MDGGVKDRFSNLARVCMATLSGKEARAQLELGPSLRRAAGRRR